jgi:hypothetical protein
MDLRLTSSAILTTTATAGAPIGMPKFTKKTTI